MEALRPAASRRSHAGSGIALALVAGVLILPASAAAGPVEDVAQRAAPLTAPVGQAVDRTDDAVPAVRQTVERSTAQIRPVVEAVTGPAPVRSTVRAVATSVGQAAPQTGPALATISERVESTVPGAPARGRQAVGRPDASGIDRAGRRSGQASVGADPGEAGGAASPASSALLDGLTAAERDRADASSTSASGDDGIDIGQPPFGVGGGNDLGGPAGIALLALGLLAAMLLLVPRFSSRLLHMSPARWGLVAFLVPIERPG
jgi:hypothetical protein